MANYRQHSNTQGLKSSDYARQQDIREEGNPRQFKESHDEIHLKSPDNKDVSDQSQAQEMTFRLKAMQGGYNKKRISFSLFNIFFGILAIVLVQRREYDIIYVNKAYCWTSIFGYSLWIVASIYSCFWFKVSWKYKTLGLYQFILVMSEILLIISFSFEYLDRKDNSQQQDQEIFSLGARIITFQLSLGFIELLYDAIVIAVLLGWSKYIDSKIQQIQRSSSKLGNLLQSNE